MRASFDSELVLTLRLARLSLLSRAAVLPHDKATVPALALAHAHAALSWSDDLSRRQMESVKWEYKPSSPQRRLLS